MEEVTKNPQIMTPEIRPLQNNDVPLKRDALDTAAVYSEDKTGFFLGVGFAAYGLGGMAAEHFANVATRSEELHVFFSVGTAIIFGSYVHMGVEMFRSSRVEKNVVEDKELAFRADRCVYKGKKPLTVGHREYRKGDNFYFVQMPQLREQDPNLPRSATQDDVQADLYDYTFKTLRESLKGKDYEFVAMNFDNPETLPIKTQVATRERIFSGNEFSVSDPMRGTLILTKEEFESLSLSPQETFEKAIEKLQDSQVTELWKLAKKTVEQDQRDQAKKLILRRINQILERDVEARFNSTPDVVRERVGANYDPVRVKHHPLTQLKRTENGFFFIQVNTASGETKWIPLDRLLQTNNQPVEAILESNSSFQRAQLAYVLSQMLSEANIEDLIRERATTKEELLAKLNALSIPAPQKKNPVETFRKTSLLTPIGRKLRPTLTTLAVFATTLGGKTVYDNWSTVRNISEAIPENKKNYKVEQTASRQGLEWKIEGTIDATGYYIHSTSHEFRDGGWNIEEDEKQDVILPTEFDPSQNPDFLSLSRTLPIHPLYENSIRIPVKDGLKLSALNVHGPDNAEVRYRIVQLEDGTVELRLAGIANTVPYADVTAYFTPATESQIKALEKVDGVDRSKLSQEIQGQLSLAESRNDKAEALFAEVAIDHHYSVSDTVNQTVAQTTSPEQFANAVANNEGADCDFANTEAILVSSTIPGIKPINMAQGFLVNELHPGGGIGNYLRTETGHAFALDSDGKIYDATPPVDVGKIDEQTQRYLDMLKGVGTNFDPNATDPWTDALNKIASDAVAQKGLMDRLKAVSAMLAGAAGTFATWQTARLLGRMRTDKNVNISQIRENLVVSPFSVKDLQRANSIFQWISWADPQSEVKLGDQNETNKPSLLESMRNTLNYEKLEAYVTNPTGINELMEKQGLKLSVLEKTKLSMLANYLLRN